MILVLSLTIALNCKSSDEFISVNPSINQLGLAPSSHRKSSLLEYLSLHS
jgi:hypothetical protein